MTAGELGGDGVEVPPDGLDPEGEVEGPGESGHCCSSANAEARAVAVAVA